MPDVNYKFKDKDGGESKGSLNTDTKKPEETENQEPEQLKTQEPETKQPEKLLAGKYKTEDELKKGIENILGKKFGDLEAAYKALEKGKTETTEAKPEDLKMDEPEDTKPGPEEIVSKYMDSYLKNGDLSEDEYQELENQGYNKTMTKLMLEGQKAQVMGSINNLLEIAGGPQAYKEALEWGKKNYSKAEREEFNNALVDPKAAKYAVKALVNDYKSQNGELVGGTSGPASSGGDGFRSREEAMKAMSDPRYNSQSMEYDPAYAEEVKRRLANRKY